MNNFTKEYIELAKDKSIQESKPVMKYGDYYSYTSNGEDYQTFWATVIDVVKGDGVIWLPTGDQLDEKISNIMPIKGVYEFKYYARMDLYKAEISFTTSNNFVEAQLHNPLICKLKLLLKLLKEKNNVKSKTNQKING